MSYPSNDQTSHGPGFPRTTKGHTPRSAGTLPGQNQARPGTPYVKQGNPNNGARQPNTKDVESDVPRGFVRNERNAGLPLKRDRKGLAGPGGFRRISPTGRP